MGEFTGTGDQHYQDAVKDDNLSKAGTGVDNEDGYQTDVPDVKADDVIKKGKEEFPCFDVSSQEFFSNQKADRKKLRFKNNSKVGEYMRKTRNSGRPFFIRTTAKDGVKYTRKVR